MLNKSQLVSSTPTPSSMWYVGGIRLKRTSRTTLEEKRNHHQEGNMQWDKRRRVQDCRMIMKVLEL
jgi:hypothetical protein